jgi:hypothetical protein
LAASIVKGVWPNKEMAQKLKNKKVTFFFIGSEFALLNHFNDTKVTLVE